MIAHSLKFPPRDLAQEVRERGWVDEDPLTHDPLWMRVAVKVYICWLDLHGWVRGKGWPS